MADGPGTALLIAVARRHLSPAAEICERDGAVALPVLEPGDLADVTDGVPVLVLAVADGDDEARLVSWVGTLGGWSQTRPDVATPDTLEPLASGSASQGDDEEEGTDPVWIVLGDLRELPPDERVHTNELVRKRDRGVRFYVPRAPRIVRRPD